MKTLKILKTLSAVMAVVTALTAIILCLNIFFSYDGGQMYTAEVIGEKLRILLWPALLWLAVILTYGLVSVPLGGNKKKDLPAKVDYEGTSPGDPEKTRRYRLILLGICLLLLVWGVVNGGMRDVLVKAINICSECIGLG